MDTNEIFPISRIQSSIRRWNIKINIALITQSRNKYWQSLLNSERVYVKQLQTVMESYYEPLFGLFTKKLEDKELPNIIISVEDLNFIFEDFKEILEVSEKILEKLEKHQENFPIIWGIGM